MRSPSVVEPDDCRARVDFAPAVDDLGRQRSGEFGGFAGLVGRAIDPAGDLHLCRRKRRFERDHALTVEHLDLLAVGLEQLHVLDAAIERLLIAVEVEDAALVAIVVDRLLGHDLVEDGLRIGGETMLEQSVAARLLRRALHQEQPGPGIEPRIGGELEAQRLMIEKQRLQQDHRRLGRRPDEGMTGRDHAGVAPARLGCDLAVALEDDDVMSVFLQLIGGRDADHAAAENDYPHDVAPCDSGDDDQGHPAELQPRYARCTLSSSSKSLPRPARTIRPLSMT